MGGCGILSLARENAMGRKGLVDGLYLDTYYDCRTHSAILTVFVVGGGSGGSGRLVKAEEMDDTIKQWEKRRRR